MKLLMLVGLALVMTCMSGCKQKMKWEEQVWLEEGRFVEVERQAEGTIDFPNSSSIVTRHQEFRYDPLQVLWKAEGVTQVESFYIVGRDAYLITMASKSQDEFCMGRRKGDLLLNVLRWRNGRVQEIDQREAPLERMRMNLSGNAHWILRKDGWAGGGRNTCHGKKLRELPGNGTTSRQVQYWIFMPEHQIYLVVKEGGVIWPGCCNQ
ncbi:hypothetical protein [Xanthomonas floridensis]|uniref:Lipoprotein n=1 Tax=Xanthomonas floridensis TaxID=1843580 RepID=A0ABU5PTG8_9XANT|nr:hypothetical protein [Xanthomonas floridensis]MEA5122890.1 hypothetical protein [Xanthomonas floridensis]MEA5130694.1 hypothetical protein [Xanthomonas floridensis]